jgi:hypothetical protein
MSDSTTLKKIIDDAADNLRTAKAELSKTPRPANVCSAHDSFFSLISAMSDVVLALATLESARLDRAAVIVDTTPPGVTGRAGEVIARFIIILTPWRWPIAIACFSPFAADVAERVITMVVRFGT